MSPLESMIWTLLGYAAMPTIFIAGFVGTIAVTCFLLEVTGNGLKE
ncbi:MAG: TIGR02808 family protein [Hahellaceae bacterium]|nr:TIGR02808 family protein [Hahellaceae bacterium]MCP5168299.1 TIGR02808 family protein [Hahellaceae bacterium]